MLSEEMRQEMENESTWLDPVWFPEGWIGQAAKLERVARAAKDVDKDAYFSMEGGKHFLVDFDIIDRLHNALADLPEGAL